MREGEERMRGRGREGEDVRKGRRGCEEGKERM